MEEKSDDGTVESLMHMASDIQNEEEDLEEDGLVQKASASDVEEDLAEGGLVQTVSASDVEEDLAEDGLVQTASASDVKEEDLAEGGLVQTVSASDVEEDLKVDGLVQTVSVSDDGEEDLAEDGLVQTASASNVKEHLKVDGLVQTVSATDVEEDLKVDGLVQTVSSSDAEEEDLKVDGLVQTVSGSQNEEEGLKVDGLVQTASGSDAEGNLKMDGPAQIISISDDEEDDLYEDALMQTASGSQNEEDLEDDGPVQTVSASEVEEDLNVDGRVQTITVSDDEEQGLEVNALVQTASAIDDAEKGLKLDGVTEQESKGNCIPTHIQKAEVGDNQVVLKTKPDVRQCPCSLSTFSRSSVNAKGVRLSTGKGELNIKVFFNLVKDADLIHLKPFIRRSIKYHTEEIDGITCVTLVYSPNNYKKDVRKLKKLKINGKKLSQFRIHNLPRIRGLNVIVLFNLAKFADLVHLKPFIQRSTKCHAEEIDGIIFVSLVYSTYHYKDDVLNLKNLEINGKKLSQFRTYNLPPLTRTRVRVNNLPANVQTELVNMLFPKAEDITIRRDEKCCALLTFPDLPYAEECLIKGKGMKITNHELTMEIIDSVHRKVLMTNGPVHEGKVPKHQQIYESLLQHVTRHRSRESEEIPPQAKKTMLDDPVNNQPDPKKGTKDSSGSLSEMHDSRAVTSNHSRAITSDHNRIVTSDRSRAVSRDGSHTVTRDRSSGSRTITRVSHAVISDRRRIGTSHRSHAVSRDRSRSLSRKRSHSVSRNRSSGRRATTRVSSAVIGHRSHAISRDRSRSVSRDRSPSVSKKRRRTESKRHRRALTRDHSSDSHAVAPVSDSHAVAPVSKERNIMKVSLTNMLKLTLNDRRQIQNMSRCMLQFPDFYDRKDMKTIVIKGQDRMIGVAMDMISKITQDYIHFNVPVPPEAKEKVFQSIPGINREIPEVNVWMLMNKYCAHILTLSGPYSNERLGDLVSKYIALVQNDQDKGSLLEYVKAHRRQLFSQLPWVPDAKHLGIFVLPMDMPPSPQPPIDIPPQPPMNIPPLPQPPMHMPPRPQPPMDIPPRPQPPMNIPPPPQPPMHMAPRPQPPMNIPSQPQPPMNIPPPPQPPMHMAPHPQPPMHMAPRPQPPMHMPLGPEPPMHLAPPYQPQIHMAPCPQPPMHMPLRHPPPMPIPPPHQPPPINQPPVQVPEPQHQIQQSQAPGSSSSQMSVHDEQMTQQIIADILAKLAPQADVHAVSNYDKMQALIKEEVNAQMIEMKKQQPGSSPNLPASSSSIHNDNRDTRSGYEREGSRDVQDDRAGLEHRASEWAQKTSRSDEHSSILEDDLREYLEETRRHQSWEHHSMHEKELQEEETWRRPHFDDHEHEGRKESWREEERSHKGYQAMREKAIIKEAEMQLEERRLLDERKKVMDERRLLKHKYLEEEEEHRQLMLKEKQKLMKERKLIEDAKRNLELQQQELDKKRIDVGQRIISERNAIRRQTSLMEPVSQAPSDSYRAPSASDSYWASSTSDPYQASSTSDLYQASSTSDVYGEMPSKQRDQSSYSGRYYNSSPHLHAAAPQVMYGVQAMSQSPGPYSVQTVSQPPSHVSSLQANHNIRPVNPNYGQIPGKRPGMMF